MPISDTGGHTIYYDRTQRTYHTWCDDGAYEPVSTALLVIVSAVFDVEPDGLETLSARVEPDALNDLVGHWRDGEPRDGGSIAFPFAGCLVTVYGDGEIVIDPVTKRGSAGDE